MRIGIATSAALKKQRTGIEEYIYQLIKHLAVLPEAREHQFFLYLNRKELGKPSPGERGEIFDWLPANFIIKPLFAPFFWTQGRLALEMLFSQPDILFMPSHVLPTIHPKNTVVTIHGLEFEYFPEFYPAFHLQYLKWATKYAVRSAQRIITISQNTKDDLIMLYGTNPQKIAVVHHGVTIPEIEFSKSLYPFPYILFLGTKEKKKNIVSLIQAFNLLKERHKILHKLILAGGKPNRRFYREENIEKIIKESQSKEDIINLDFVSEEEKWNLLKNAKVFVYPSFYEGFGIPILEAQAAGVPVITSNISALPEIAGSGAILINPKKIEELAQAIYKIIEDNDLRSEIIRRGQENIKRFTWEKCAKKTLEILIDNF